MLTLCMFVYARTCWCTPPWIPLARCPRSTAPFDRFTSLGRSTKPDRCLRQLAPPTLIPSIALSPSRYFVLLFSDVLHVGDAIDVEKVTPKLLQIRTGRGKSLESLEDPTERTHHTFSAENTHTTFHYNQPQVGWRPRSYDDGDITPTNETGLFYEGGGTLPRPRGIIRPRQIAKITAKVR